MAQENKKHGQSVLVARFSALGDVAMTIPALYSACRAWPDTQFVLVTRKANAGIFINKPANLVVEPIDLKNDYAGATAMPRLVADMAKKYGCSAFIDLHDVLRTKIMRLCCMLRGWKVSKIDKGRSQKKKILADTARGVAPTCQLENSVDRYRAAIARAGFPFEYDFHSVYGTGSKGDPSLFERVTGPKAPGQKWVGIAPFAAHGLKQCPMHVMYDVAEALTKVHGCKVIVFGAGSEEMKKGRPLDKIPGVISIIGRDLGWAGEMALMSHLDVMISMDSANMHLAAIAGAPVVSIWGPTHPCFGFSPWGQGPERMVMPQSECSPCSVFGNKPCHMRQPKCMPSAAAPILAAVLPLINKK